MNVTVYVPKDLEAELKRKSDEANLSPSLLIQSLLREALSAEPVRFSASFAALAGTWQDQRTVEEIVRDIAEHRSSVSRGALD